MEKIKNKLILSSALIISAGLLGGCATNQEAITNAQNAATKAGEAAAAAKSQAQEALNAANNAQATADEALSKARAAADTASQALSNSESNRAAIDELNEKIERMFKKTMHK